MHAETVLGVCTEGGVVGEQLRMRQVCQIPLCDLVSNAFISPPLSSLTGLVLTACSKGQKLSNGCGGSHKSSKEVSLHLSSAQNQHCAIFPRAKIPPQLFIPILAQLPPPLLVSTFENRLHPCGLIFRTW